MNRRLPILRMAAEAVIIITSILLAFGIDAWWDDRQDRIEETEILLGLKREFTQSRQTLEQQIERHSDGLLAMEELLTATELDRWNNSNRSVDDAFNELMTPPTTDLGSGVLDALVSAGRLQILSNNELRTRLAAWNGVFEEMRDDEIMDRELVFYHVVPYLTRWGVPLSGAFSHSRKRLPMTITDDADAASRLWADPEFRSILGVRYGFKSHTTGEYEAALEAIDEILRQINESLAE
jgi:hypothetical protein